ncbi:MAG: hypothetical protein HS130_03595 [Deltaproteobacteria bacterium]|nr:hypothetical protein [Deltaproteobacteria bacterium]
MKSTQVLEVPHKKPRWPAVSPGVGFGEYGDDYVRLALVENEHRIRQAAKCIQKALEGSAKEAV